MAMLESRNVVGLAPLLGEQKPHSVDDPGKDEDIAFFAPESV